MRLVITFFSLIALTGCGRHYTTHRSPLRKPSQQIPTIVVSDDMNPHSYARSCNHYKKDPIFTVFDYQFFLDHQVPTTGITTGNEKPMVKKKKLDKILHNILFALKEQNSPLPHCTIMHDRNFNYTTQCGLIILKLHDYPLVIKLFKETPESFVSPFTKGFEPTTFFFMSGGSNRHIAGLTRIPNRLRLLAQIEQSEQWKDRVIIPRKWYWTPQPIEWLRIDGYHLDAKTNLHTEIPATYAVIADYVAAEQTTSLDPEMQKDLIMDLCTLCSLHLDPHMKNFVISTKPDSEIPIITIIDTEDHACMTGLTEPVTYTTHIEWYTVLTRKFLKDLLFNVKQEHDGNYS